MRIKVQQRITAKEKVKIISRPGQANTAALLFLIAVIAEYSKEKNLHLTIPLTRYYQLRNSNNPKYMRRQINEALEYWNHVVFSIYEAHSRKWLSISIFTEPPQIRAGAIFLHLSADLKKLMPQQKIMHLPASVFQLEQGEKTPTRLLMVWRICQHQRINQFQGTFTIPIKTLLAACGNLPHFDELNDGHSGREIILPFENALDRCRNIFSWQYEMSDGFDWWQFYEDRIIITMKEPNLPEKG